MDQNTLDTAVRTTSRWSTELLASLVACPSTTGKPSQINSLLEEALLNLDLEVSSREVGLDALSRNDEYSPPSHVEGTPSPAIIASWQGKAELPELLLFAHSDTEPVQDGWVQPYDMRVIDGRAVGLGVADDKGGIVAILAAVRAIREVGVAITRRPKIVFGSGKQGGALGMLPGVLAAEGVTGAVYSHPAESGNGLTHLKVASRGVVEVEVAVVGETPSPVEERTPVSADPRLGHNAAERAARLARVVTEQTDRVVRTITGFSAHARPFEVPDSASFVVAHWFSEGSVAGVIDGLTQLLTSAAADDWERATPPRVTAVGIRANPASCAGTQFARWAASTVTSVTSHKIVDYAWHSASDIRFPIRCLGVPAVGLGAKAGNFYGPNEWVDLESLSTCSIVLARMLTQ